MKLFQKLIAAPAIISMASGLAVNASEINSTDLSDYSNSNKLVSLGDFKSDTLFPGDWTYDSLKDLTNSPRFNGNSVTRLEAAAELNNLIAGGEGLMNGAQIDRLSDELGSELAIMKGRVDGLEARVNGIEAGSFSETTTMKGKAQFLIGATDTEDNSDESTMFNYHWEIDLNTSFTGDDKLNVEFAAGNTDGKLTVGELTGFGESQDELKIEDLNYSFPLGGFDVGVGISYDASKKWPNACSYSQIVDSMDDCGAKNSVDLGGDTSLSVGYEFDNGWAFGFGISADDAEKTKGAFTAESDDFYGAAFGYEGDTYGLTVAYSNKEKDLVATSYWGATAFWSPEGMGTLSGGIELGNPENSSDETTQWVIGYTSDLGEGEIQLGVGTNGSIADGADEQYVYELGYEYPLNDSTKIQPFVFIAEEKAGDTTGLGLLTTFKF